MWFEAAPTRTLTADEMLASLREASGLNAAARAKGVPPESLKTQVDVYLRSYVPDVAPEGEVYQASLQERLFFDNSTRFQDLLEVRKGNLAEAIRDAKTSWEDRVDRLYLTVLTRPPRPGERTTAPRALRPPTPSRRNTLVDEADLEPPENTSSEFRFRR